MAAMITLLPPRAAVPSRCRRCARRWPTRASSTACWKRNWPRPSNRVAPAPCWWRKAPAHARHPHPLRKPAGPAQAAPRKSTNWHRWTTATWAACCWSRRARRSCAAFPAARHRWPRRAGPARAADEMADTQFSSDMSGVEIDPDDRCCCARRSPAAQADQPGRAGQSGRRSRRGGPDHRQHQFRRLAAGPGRHQRHHGSARDRRRGRQRHHGSGAGRAGGNVTVKGGIIGMAEAMQDASVPPAPRTSSAAAS